MTEKQKMLAGKPYFGFDEELFCERQHAKDLVCRINTLHPQKIDERNSLFKALFAKTTGNFHIEPPFYCDYGYNIFLGENFYANYNCIILDCAGVHIGDNVMFGPNVNIYTAGHPLDAEKRNSGLEYAQPIHIGNNVWIGGHTVVNPGITIGYNTVIGSGSVVTKNIPSNVIAAGNPCKVLRAVNKEDKLYYFKKMQF